MSSTNRRSFLARGAALAAIPTVAAPATGVLADQAIRLDLGEGSQVHA